MRSIVTDAHWASRSLAVMVCAYLLLTATPAMAHVTVSPGQATAGEHANIDVRVGHGCDGSFTTEISVQIPDTVASVTPEFLPGWSVDTTMGPLAEPVERHGETVGEGIREVTWSGGPAIPDHLFFDFGLSVQMPDTPGETLYFPVVQTCEDGETRWIEIPAEGGDGHDLEFPAPAVELVAANAAPDSDDHGNAAEGGSEAAMASEPVATAQLATAEGDSGGSGLMVAAVIVAGIALVALLGVMVAGRRGTG